MLANIEPRRWPQSNTIYLNIKAVVKSKKWPFTFADEISIQNNDLCMASFDVDALFTNITLDKTNDICVEQTF